MKNKLLLPNRYKTIGWIILIPTTILGIILAISDFEAFKMDAKVFSIYYDEIIGGTHWFHFATTSVTNSIVAVFFIVGSLLVGFSREKQEDEFIANLRLSSLQWAVLVNSMLLIFFTVFIWGLAFTYVMMYNMFTVMIIFIARFNYLLFKNSKLPADEK